MFLDSLFFILIIVLFIIIIISIAFYGRVRVRTYYTSNVSTGDNITFTPQSNGFFTISPLGNQLDFIPLQVDRNRKINGRLVLLVNSTNTSENFYKVRVMNGTSQVSEGIYSINRNMSYMSINFEASASNNRTLSIQIQGYDPKTKQSITATPANLNLVQAYSWYY